MYLGEDTSVTSAQHALVYIGVYICVVLIFAASIYMYKVYYKTHRDLPAWMRRFVSKERHVDIAAAGALIVHDMESKYMWCTCVSHRAEFAELVEGETA